MDHGEKILDEIIESMDNMSEETFNMHLDEALIMDTKMKEYSQLLNAPDESI